MAATDLLCVELFHVYLDEKTMESHLRRQIRPTAAMLAALLSSESPRSCRFLVMIDDYFAFHHRAPGDRQRAGREHDWRTLEGRFAGWVASAWRDCWLELASLRGTAFAGAPPRLTFVRESDFEPLAWSLSKALVPRLRLNGSASKYLDGSAWRRAPWTAGPIGSWLANDRPPRSAPRRPREFQQRHAVLDSRLAGRHSIHLDIELFDCNACRFGGRCDGFGRCDATARRRPDLRISCALLAAALQVGRVSAGAVYGPPAVPALELRRGSLLATGDFLEPMDRAASVLDVRFLEVEHAVAVILDHLPVDLPRPSYAFIAGGEC